MKKVIDYKIIRGHAISNFEVFIDKKPEGHILFQVKKAIKEGWQPIGGASQDDSYYIQTMVKYEE